MLHAASMTPSPAAGGQPAPPFAVGLPMLPYRLSGTVIGALLNDPAMLAAMGDAVLAPPHKGAPRAPVLEVKPRHTWAQHGQSVAVPRQPGEVVVGAALGIVLGRCVSRADVQQATAAVAGYVIVGDLSLPLPGHYRPSVRLKARDGFCVFGPEVVAAAAVGAPDALTLEVLVDGRLQHRASTAGRVRGVAALVADISEFMTLGAGDIVLLGQAHGAPRACIGQGVEIRLAGFEALRFSLIAEPEAGAAARPGGAA